MRRDRGRARHGSHVDIVETSGICMRAESRGGKLSCISGCVTLLQMVDCYDSMKGISLQNRDNLFILRAIRDRHSSAESTAYGHWQSEAVCDTAITVCC